MTDTKLYFGGIPTAPDVDKIMKALGVPDPGPIAHEELEGLIGEKREASRYRTVTSAWRKRLFQEHNVEVAAEPGLGFRVLTAAERVEYQSRRHRGAVRHAVAVHNHTVAIPVEELDDLARRKFDHLMRATAMLGQEALRSSTDLRKALKAASV